MSFRVAIPSEYCHPDGRPLWPGIGREGLEDLPDVEVDFWRESAAHATPALLRDYDALIAPGMRFNDASFEGVERLVLLARFGVGYDAVDLDACTRAGVLVTITRGAADRPVAEGALTMLLAAGHFLVQKDRLTRAGRWDDRRDWIGVELRDRNVGIVGFGGIGRELARLLQPFGVSRLLVADPHVPAHAVLAAGAEHVSLEKLLHESDFVSLHCPLTAETRGLIGERELGLMKPTAFLVNTARGPVVDQAALTRALQEGRIRGAALDVFADEPIAPDDPLLSLDNVVLNPHHIAVTEELYRDYYRSCLSQLLAVRRGQPPAHVVNPEVLGTPRLEAKLARLRDAHRRLG